MMGASRLSNLS